MLQPLLQVGLLVLGALGAGEVGVGAARVAAHVLPSHRGIQPAIQLTLHPSGINQFHQGVRDIEFSSAGLFGALHCTDTPLLNIVLMKKIFFKICFEHTFLSLVILC